MAVSADAPDSESAELLLGFRPNITSEATAEGTCRVERYTCNQLRDRWTTVTNSARKNLTCEGYRYPKRSNVYLDSARRSG